MYKNMDKDYKMTIGKDVINNNIKRKFYLNLDDNDKFISYWGLMSHHKTYNIRKIIWHLLLEMTRNDCKAWEHDI